MHLVAAALEGLAVGQHLGADAGVDVVDAALDAAGDHVVAVLLELGIAQADADPAVALAAPPTTLSIRFQWPPRQTAEIIRPVLPQRRYSMSGL